MKNRTDREAMNQTGKSFGSRLRWWRERRGLSQLDLAGAAGTSQRHVSFLESGRTAPSREMVLRLAATLNVPLRQQNELLLAAGYAPAWRESDLSAPELAKVNSALDYMLAQQEPYPAFVLDRRWNLLRANTGARRLTEFLTGPAPANPAPSEPVNLAVGLMSPDGLRPFIVNWEEVALYFLRGDYEVTRSRLEVVGGRLHSKVNEQSYGIGNLETPSLKKLRQRAQLALCNLDGRVKVSCVFGDVRTMHRDPANENALFQVASQFNLLEMTGPAVSPEEGVTRYSHDHTQGPACAIAAGAATICRNYFADVDGHSGQKRNRQIDCLSDLGAALGNNSEALWTMRNGYALCTEKGLTAIDHRLAASSDAQIDELRGLLRIGLHWNVEVTDTQNPRPLVSQAFCSALPVSYSSIPAHRWRAFATLVLEGAYEATLWAAILNMQRSSPNVVFLTQVGGGAFGNDDSWVQSALRRAVEMVKAIGLDVRIVSYGSPSAELVHLANGY